MAEPGDITQLAAVTVSARRSPTSVFIGAMFAFALVDDLTALLGGAISAYSPIYWIMIASGLVFFFGLHSLNRAKEEEEVEVKDRGLPLLTSFSLIALMELGHKTQLAVVAMASTHNDPVMVFVGKMLAFALINGLGVVLGATLMKRLPTRYLRVGSSVMFTLLGIAFLISPISGITVF